MNPTRIPLLQQMPIFGGLSASTLELLLDATSEVQVPAGEYFFHEGDAGDALYVLERGHVQVQRATPRGLAVLRRLGPGDCLGEMAVIDLAPRSASVRALQDCAAFTLPAGQLHRLYQHDLEQFALLQMNLAREMSRRLRAAVDQWARTGTLDIG